MSTNLIVTVRVALKVVPGPVERQGLSASLCARIKAAEQKPLTPLPVGLVSPVRAERNGLGLSLDGDFSVPNKMLPAVNQLRADFFRKAAEVMVRSSQRFAQEHPGVTLHSVQGVGDNAVRFFMDGALGGFDVLTDVVVAKGAQRPGEVELKNTLYYDWQAAGLPMQVGLQSLLQPAAH